MKSWMNFFNNQIGTTFINKKFYKPNHCHATKHSNYPQKLRNCGFILFLNRIPYCLKTITILIFNLSSNYSRLNWLQSHIFKSYWNITWKYFPTLDMLRRRPEAPLGLKSRFKVIWYLSLKKFLPTLAHTTPRLLPIP